MTRTEQDIAEARRTLALASEQAPRRLAGLSAAQRRKAMREVRESLAAMGRHAANMATYAAREGDEATEAYEQEKELFARANRCLLNFCANPALYLI